MRLVIERENATTAGNVPGRLYVDGRFFAYTLENNALKIPAGTFRAYNRFSPTNAAYKVHIDVPGRKYIMFHGGNIAAKDGTAIDSTGCVLVARNRINPDYIQGNASDELYTLVKPKFEAGEPVTVTVKNPTKWPLVFAVAAAGYLILKR